MRRWREAEREKRKDTCETVFTAHLSALYIERKRAICRSLAIRITVSLAQAAVLMNVDSLEKSFTFFRERSNFTFT